jgi:nucleoside-diphosphate-sugar epimerase/predicted dehydrogenase
VTPVRAALIGCGQVAHFHVEALRSAPGAELVAVCDRDEQRAAEAAALEPGCRAYTDVAELLERERPGAVHILTPPATHAPLAVQAAQAGCHALVEKPFALSVAEADTMIAAAREHGVTLAANHNYLLKPSVAKARQLVAEGAIGDVVFVESYYGLTDEAASFAGAGGAHWSYRLPGGIFTNFLPHVVYLQAEFLGGIESVSGVALSTDPRAGGEASELTVLLQGATGTGVMEISTRARPYAKYVRLFGTRGIVHADLVGEVTTIHRQRRVPRLVSKALFNLEQIPQLATGTVVNSAKVLSGSMRNMPDLHNTVRDLYAALEEGREPPFSGEDGRANVAVMEQVWEKMPARGEPAPPPATEEPGTPRTAVERRLADSGALRGKTVLVTGAAGFLGRHLASALLRCGAEVRMLVRDPSRVSFELERDAEVVPGNLGDREAVAAAVDGSDLVFHCAAVTTNNVAWKTHQETNIDGTRVVLEEALRAGVERVVHVSSVVVYGVESGNGPVSESAPYDEDRDRWAYYLRSKLAADRIARDFSRETKLPVTIVRPGLIYGPGADAPLKKGLVQIGPARLTIGRADNAVPLTYVDNVVDGLLLAGTVEQAAGEAYNLIDDPQIETRAAAASVDEITGDRTRLVPLPKPLLMAAAGWLERRSERADSEVPPKLSRFQLDQQARDVRYDAGKARRELGWEPEVSLEEGMRRALAGDA